jgi:hypothetical protein
MGVVGRILAWEIMKTLLVEVAALNGTVPGKKIRLKTCKNI